MQVSTRLMAFIGVLAVVVVTCAPSLPPAVHAQEKAQSPKWEYKAATESILADEKKTEATLKSLGDDGWELVTATLVPGSGAGDIRYVLKRPKK